MTAATRRGAWTPEWRASDAGPTGQIGLVFAEAINRHPAMAILETLHLDDEVHQAIHDLRWDAYHLGLEAAGLLAERGQPSPEKGYQSFLTDLVTRANVPQVAGQVEADGLFHPTE